MPVVPIGLNFQAWKKATPHNDDGSSSAREVFSSNNNNNNNTLNNEPGFNVVKTPRPRYHSGKLENKYRNRKMTALISPLQPIIDQSRDLQKQSKVVDADSLSLNIDKTSTVPGRDSSSSSSSRPNTKSTSKKKNTAKRKRQTGSSSSSHDAKNKKRRTYINNLKKRAVS